MDLETRYTRLKNLIKEHEWLIQSEILNHYPAPLPEKYQSLIKSLSLNSPQDLCDIENLVINEQQNDGVKDFLNVIITLVSLPKTEIKRNNIEKEFTHQIGLKKQHEINQIIFFIQEHSFSHIYDLCSGKAHLAHILSLSRSEKMIALDFDPKLQESGKYLFERYFKNSPNKCLSYLKHDLTEPFKRLEEEKKTLLIGLHACGDLSSNIIKQVSKDSNVLSIGCCYHKIFLTQNLSNIANKFPLELSFHALSLANKANRFMDTAAWRRRHKVKLYRYALHMIDQHHCLELEDINQLHFSHYENSFQDYAQKLTRKKLEFETLYQEHKNSRIMHEYLLLESLRIALGRAIEIFILVDRALFLQENGHSVQLTEIFDKKISPRNIAITNWT